jgi:histidinol-phosphate aminotransferase
MDIHELIQTHIWDLEPYEPPDWEALGQRVGVSPAQIVRLDANENAYGPSFKVRQALADAENYGFYPNYRALQKAVAQYAGVDPQQVLLGNGGDEIIDLVVRLLVAPGEAAVVCPPAFGMYAIRTFAQGGHVLAVPRGDDFSLDVDAIAALVGGSPDGPRPKVLFVASPGNPDGLPVATASLRRLLELPLVVVVDEAYIEFGGETAVPLLETHPNLVVLRTFSKWAGLAGLRLGYALAAPQMAAALARLRLPYNVNTAAVIAGLASLDDRAQIQAHVQRIIADRERLRTALATIPGVHPLPSQANFLLCRFDGRDGQEIADSLAQRGILVRSFSDPRLADAIRVTIGRPEQNDDFLSALRATVGGREPSGSHHRAGPQPSAVPTSRGPGPQRRAIIHRQTRETDATASLVLDGTGQYQISTGLGFLDHMLAQLAAHGLFDLEVRAQGDLHVDAHHTVEDVGIALGQAIDEALGERQGIVRMGSAYAPLDEALAHVVIDLSGRPYAVVEAEFATPRIGALDADLVIHFLETLAVHARMSLHARVLYGRNDHHKAEALFKALGRALDAASRPEPRRQGIPSTKGVL